MGRGVIITDFESVVVRQAIDQLAIHGQAISQYVTSGLGPPTERNNPDLVFIPFEGQYADTPHLVEVRFTAHGIVPDLLLVQAVHHMTKVRHANGEALKFAIAVNGELTALQRGWADSHGLVVFDGVRIGSDLRDHVVRWAGLGAV